MDESEDTRVHVVMNKDPKKMAKTTRSGRVVKAP